MRRTYQLSVLCLVGLFATACATQGYDQALSTAISMSDTRAEILSGKQQIDRTINALNVMKRKPNQDLRPLYRNFVSELQALDGVAVRVGNRADDMKNRGDQYFTSWKGGSQEVQNPKLRKLSQARKQEARASFNRMTAQLEKTKIAYKPLMSDLRDIETHLGFDLNPKGLRAVDELIRKANKDAAVVKKRINQSVVELGRVSKEITPHPDRI